MGYHKHYYRTGKGKGFSRSITIGQLESRLDLGLVFMGIGIGSAGGIYHCFFGLFSDIIRVARFVGKAM